jgi:hypothetical protein
LFFLKKEEINGERQEKSIVLLEREFCGENIALLIIRTDSNLFIQTLFIGNNSIGFAERFSSGAYANHKDYQPFEFLTACGRRNFIANNIDSAKCSPDPRSA